MITVACRCQLLRDELMSLTAQLQGTSERGAVQAAQHAHVLKQLAAAEADNMVSFM